MTHIMLPKRGRKAFDALREAGASLVRTWDDGGQRWDFPDGRNACVVTPSGTLYVRKAGTDIALAADSNVTRTYDDGGVAYHVGISTPGVGGGGRPAAARTKCSCGMQAPLAHDGFCESCGARLPAVAGES